MMERSIIDAPLHLLQHLEPAPTYKGKGSPKEILLPSPLTKKIEVRSPLFTNFFDLGLAHDYCDQSLAKRMARQKALSLHRFPYHPIRLKGRFSDRSPFLGYPPSIRGEDPISAVRLLTALNKLPLTPALLKELGLPQSSTTLFGFPLRRYDGKGKKIALTVSKESVGRGKETGKDRSPRWRLKVLLNLPLRVPFRDSKG